MWKLLLSLSLISLITLSIGTAFFPSFAAFWLASGSVPFQIVRGVLGLILLEQLFTRPPRKAWIRILAGVGSVGVISWTLTLFYNYNMSLLDVMTFMAAGITVGITALEKRKTYNVAYSDKYFKTDKAGFVTRIT